MFRHCALAISFGQGLFDEAGGVDLAVRGCCVGARMLEDYALASWMLLHVVGHIVHLSVDDDPAVAAGVVFL